MKTSIETNRINALEKIVRHLQNEMAIKKIQVVISLDIDEIANTRKISFSWNKYFQNYLETEFISYNEKNEPVDISNANKIKGLLGDGLFDLISDKNEMDELYGN